MNKEYSELRKNYDFFLASLDEILAEHRGEFVLIHDCKVITYFKTRNEALDFGAARFTLGTFLVKQVIPENEMQTYSSFRVTYA